MRLDDISSMGVRLGNVTLQANRPFAERHPALVLQLSLTDPADRERINDFWLVAEPRNERAEAEDGETRGQLGLAFTHYAESVEEGLAWHKLEHGDEVPGLGDTVFRYHVLVHRARKGLDDEDQAQRERRRAEKLDSDLDDIINRSGRKG
ncbi:hypothetical protein [Desulfohalovibrio reitneri]|uniref:hypothetical protein n=1 Tax=Desulfohalovibrio reitneri TaxID=1307759 RepID=UPI00110EC781|nr:hypothetical protein [Desulfohalovibrio reitneri]